jgi:PAS domain S-box-containing protein
MDTTLSQMPGEETVSERVRRLEAALAAAEERLADALDVSLAWVWETDAELRFVRFVGRLQDILGVAPSRIIGKTVEDFVVDRGDEHVERQLAAIRRRQPYYDFIFRINTPKGVRHVKASGKPLLDRSGAFRGYRGTANDITATIEAEHRAATIHRRFAEAIENIPASLMLCDAEDRIVICNSATRRYFPTAPHLLVPGTRFEDLVRAQAESGLIPDAVTDMEAWVGERMRRHRAADTVLTRAHRDGSWIQIIERRTSEGGTIAIRIDVTELKQREQQIAEYTKDLERSNAELEQFAYVASHDLQEPLRMVASYCQLLQRRYKNKLDPDADDFIGYAVEGASRMQRLINDLLTYSRVGRRGGTFKPTALNEVVDLALANLQGTIADAGAQVEVGELPTVNGDRTQLGLLFQNLVNNAMKFRREEPPVVRIGALREDELWHFTVEDNGIGIEPEYVERVFLIFQRLHERSKYPGTGIGLAIAKKVVEHHGGRIWIESTPGQGSRFHFTLPVIITPEVF